jgi:DNA recombination protein RmuC
MSEALMLILGLIAGGVIGASFAWLRAKGRLAPDSAAAGATIGELRSQIAVRDRELTSLRQAYESEKVTAADGKARLESAREHFTEQRRQIAEMEQKVKDTFGALSAAALKNSSEQFITLADEKLNPLRQQLKRYEDQIAALEKSRQEAYGGLSEKLVSLDQRSAALGKEAGNLVSLLRASGTKGKWGEVTLQRIVEMLGMSAQCDFEMQATLDNRSRPDLLVKLPGGRVLAVDSKVNTSAYLDAVSAEVESERKACMARFVSDVSNTAKRLAAKEYWKQLTPNPEFVVMFMPGEAFFSAALLADPDLLIQCAEQKVLLASPTTLIALLLAVRHGWQQQQVAENAQRIADAGRELYDRMCTFVTHLDNLRKGLDKAVEAYNGAVGNWEGRTMPYARKLKELGAAETGKEMIEPGLLESTLRPAPTMENDPPATYRQIA